MRAAVVGLLAGKLCGVAQPPGGHTYRKPTLIQVSALEHKLASTDAPGPAGIKSLIREAAGAVAPHLWRLGVRQALTPRIAVLLYHRVSDDTRDNLTVGIEQFERQMVLLREHCQPLSIEDVVDLDVIPRTGGPFVCVTFDDGYLDNYLNAVPILIKHQIPAAFFVATGMIGTNRSFPHDLRRGRPDIPTMSWLHLREMHAAGFVIGSHSVTHIDCASEPEQIVADELTTSHADLRRELGIERAIFAYPYGGRQHMTAQRLEMVKGAGYRGCLSAYGGTNVGKVDRFNVLRGGIHWGFSDRALLLQCLGVR